MTQENKILNYLKQGKSLTSLEATELFYCTRLPAVIGNLKSKGYCFNAELLKSGNGGMYARYTIIQPKIYKQLTISL